MIINNVLFLGVVLAFCWAVAFYDWKTLTIPNIVPLSLILLFLMSSPFLIDGLAAFGWQLLSFVIAFIVSFILYMIGPMGGGDVKFFTALSLLVKVDMLLVWILYVTLSGLAITFIYMVIKMSGLKRTAGLSVKESYAAIRGTEIPYGPAITLGTTLLAISF